jgi:formate hydrogenlyase subunit 3/multisubunit Na+/H+ antiporter MnhD subunit
MNLLLTIITPVFNSVNLLKDTLESIYSKIYAELGLIPFLLFLSFLIYLYRKIRKLSYSKHYLFLSITYSLSLVYILNADSIINLNYFLYLVLIALIIKHENRVFNAS